MITDVFTQIIPERNVCVRPLYKILSIRVADVWVILVGLVMLGIKAKK